MSRIYNGGDYGETIEAAFEGKEEICVGAGRGCRDRAVLCEDLH